MMADGRTMPASYPHVSFVIVNYNTADLLIRCLESIAQFGGARSEIVVVDNASSDDSVAQVQARFPAATLVQNEVNRGFPAAVNQGFASSAAPLVFVLNSDVFLTASTMAPLLKRMASDQRVGIAAPLQNDEDGQPLLSAHLNRTLGWEWGRNAFLLDVLRYRLLGRWIIKRYRKPVQIDWATGAALLVRRETFEAVNGMDSKIFLFAEEYDFQWRAKKKGWSTWFVPSSEVIHIKNASIGKVLNHGRLSSVTRSGLYVSAKHHGISRLPFFVLAQLSGSLLRIILASLPALLFIPVARNQLREHWLVMKMLLSPSTYRWIQDRLSR